MAKISQHFASKVLGLPTNNTLARSLRKGFRGFAQFLLPLFSTISAGEAVSFPYSTLVARSRRRSLPFCRGSSARLLSSGFNDGRPNWADRFQLGTSRRGRARCSFLLDLGFSFHRRGSCRDSWSRRGRRFRVRRACSGWLRNRSVILPLRSKRSCRTHLVKRGRDGFLFARLGFGSRGCSRFRRGLLRLRRRRCLLGSLRFCLMRNDYFLRVHPSEKHKAAE
jgi:hypothetical protein